MCAAMLHAAWHRRLEAPTKRMLEQYVTRFESLSVLPGVAGVATSPSVPERGARELTLIVVEPKT